MFVSLSKCPLFNAYAVSTQYLRPFCRKLPTLEQNKGNKTSTASLLRPEVSSTNLFIIVPEHKRITQLCFILFHCCNQSSVVSSPNHRPPL